MQCAVCSLMCTILSVECGVRSVQCSIECAVLPAIMDHKKLEGGVRVHPC